MSLDFTIPSAVIVSSSSTKPKSLIKLITYSTAFEDPSLPFLVSKEWKIKTKYYSATINLLGITEGFIYTNEFNKSVEALIIHMDSNRASGLSDLDKWSPIIKNCNLEVKLLVANYFTPQTKISKMGATKWCLERGFELVELYPSGDVEDSEYNNVIEEKTGINRVIEALEAHVWPNLVKNPPNNSVRQVDQPETSSLEFEKSLDEFLINDDIDDFTELFSKLSQFKDSISAMSSSQRKQNAEQLVTSFWHAMGGDEEELEDV